MVEIIFLNNLTMAGWIYVPSHGDSNVSSPMMNPKGGACFPRYHFLIAVVSLFSTIMIHFHILTRRLSRENRRHESEMSVYFLLMSRIAVGSNALDRRSAKRVAIKDIGAKRNRRDKLMSEARVSAASGQLIDKLTGGRSKRKRPINVIN